jgi:hypothetical protein
MSHLVDAQRIPITRTIPGGRGAVALSMSRPESPFSAVKSPTTASIRGESLCYESLCNPSSRIRACLAILFGAHRLFRIPQNFSQANHFSSARVSRRRNFRDPASWTAGAPIPGELTGNKSRLTSMIEAPGEVFGHCEKYQTPAESGKEVAEGNCEL